MSRPPIRTLLVGCGGMGRTWLRLALALPELEIVGVGEGHAAAEAVAAQHGALRIDPVGAGERAAVEVRPGCGDVFERAGEAVQPSLRCVPR